MEAEQVNPAIGSNLVNTFGSFQQYLQSDHDAREDIRGAVREIEQLARQILASIQAVHYNAKDEVLVKEICKNARDTFSLVRGKIGELSGKVATGQYYRFHDHWRFVFQRLAFLATFIIFMETEKLASREETTNMLGVKVDWKDGFHLDLDDYLIGTLQLASELSRLAVNSVTSGDYTRPRRIAAFISELDSAFRMLNLKNDALRKRFDGLKYDLKKVEEVVYDLTIRGLKPVESAA